MTDIALLPARRLASLIRRKKIGCVELLDHYLDRVERFNPTLNAIVVTQIPEARRRALAADRALAKGELWGPLHGVPMTVKESFDVKGLPTTWGSPAFRDNIAHRNALAVDRWLSAGVTLFGKTNVPLFLADSQAFNDIYGRTNNPWDLARTPGGSSGGATAALAAGMTGIEMGSDIASSLRNPASFCGLFSHKPTYGICPPRGHALGGDVGSADISVIGPLARSAGDAALGLSILAGPDEIDGAGWRLSLPAPRQKRLRDFRIAVVMDQEIGPVDRSVVTLLQRLADFLGRQKARLSDSVRPAIDMTVASRTFDILLRAATSARLPDAQIALFQAQRAALDPGDDSKRARMLAGNTLSHREWLKLDEARHRLRWTWHEFFREWDLLLCPAFGTAAFPHDPTPPYDRHLVVDGRKVPFHTQTFWSGFTGLAFLPSSVAPIGFTEDGLPVGVQIVGPQYGDRTCLHLAKLLEKEYQGFVPPPGYG